jgi:hypothetical protein
MREEQLNLKVLTTMNEATDPTDRSELRDKLETARFEEILYWEGRKDAYFRLIVCLLILILVAVTLQLLTPFQLADKPAHDQPVAQRADWFDLFARPTTKGTR